METWQEQESKDNKYMYHQSMIKVDRFLRGQVSGVIKMGHLHIIP
jgi:hypothetical protein